MKVVGIAGQLGNGKDVLADYLCRRLNDYLVCDWQYKNNVFLGPFWRRGAFANAVKETFEKAFGVDREFVELWKRNPEPPPGYLKNIRKSLQSIGDGFRTIKDDIWIDIALRDEFRQLVISDSRYINEARAIRKKGGVMIVLHRPGFLNDDPNPSESQIRPVVDWCVSTGQKDGPIHFDVPHYSYGQSGVTEEIMRNYDLFINNDGTVEDLYRKVDEIFVPWIMDKYAGI